MDIVSVKKVSLDVTFISAEEDSTISSLNKSARPLKKIVESEEVATKVSDHSDDNSKHVKHHREIAPVST